MGALVKKIARTIPLIFIVMSIVLGIASVGLYVAYYYKKNHYLSVEKQKLAEVARGREHEILNYLDDQEIKIADLARADETRMLLARVRATNNHDDVNTYFSRYKKTYDYKNILFISPKAEVLFALNNDQLIGINLTKNAYKKSALTQSYSRAIMTASVDIAAFEYSSLVEQMALFLCTPVFNEQKKLIGVLAVQVNDQALASIIESYKDLGQTGEVVLAMKKSNGVSLVFPSRYDESGVVTSQGKESGVALQKAVLGMRGSGMVLDYRGQEVFALWRYIPDVAWGFVTKIDKTEIIRPLHSYFWLALLSSLLALFFALSAFIIRLYREILWFIRQSHRLRKIFIALLVVSVLITGVLIYRYQALKHRSTQLMRQEAQHKVAQAKERIVNRLDQAEFVAQTIADDLSAGRLRKNDISIRMKRDMQEYPNMLGITIAYEPFAYDAKTKLFSPIIIRTDEGLEQQAIESFYDYTQPERPGQALTRWYTIPLRQGDQWVEPYVEPLTNKLAAVYSVPFFEVDDTQKKNPIGVVSILYSIDKIKEVVEEIGVGRTGYSFIISKAGYFLYHPISEYVQKQKTVFEIADSLNNAALRAIGDQAVRGEKGFSHYVNEITAQQSSVYYEPIPEIGWSVGITFLQGEGPIPSSTWRQYQIGILISVLSMLLVLGVLVTRLHAGVGVVLYSIISSVILACGIAFVWMLVYQTSSTEYAQGVSVLDKIGLNKFIDSVNRKASSNYEPFPVVIPTGIYVKSLSFPEPMQVEFTADVWQRYDIEQHADITRGIVFPQALSIEIIERYRETDGKSETIGWAVKGVLAQNFEYAHYPFDIKNIAIEMDHKDRTNNIVLVPDFESYRLLNPTTKPGIDESVAIPAFAVKKSSFSFMTQKAKVDFGVHETEASRTDLNFNIALRRNLVDAIVVFLLPLLVILVALYAALWFTYEIPSRSIAYRPLAAYTGLVFALVILHRTFREKLPSGQIIYLEYFFFFTYLTIVILIINALLLYSRSSLHKNARRITYALRFLYWPLELITWFIATIIIFT